MVKKKLLWMTEWRTGRSICEWVTSSASGEELKGDSASEKWFCSVPAETKQRSFTSRVWKTNSTSVDMCREDACTYLRTGSRVRAGELELAEGCWKKDTRPSVTLLLDRLLHLTETHVNPHTCKSPFTTEGGGVPSTSGATENKTPTWWFPSKYSDGCMIWLQSMRVYQYLLRWNTSQFLPGADPPLVAQRAADGGLCWRENPSFPFQRTHPAPSATSSKEITVRHKCAEERSLTRAKLKEQTPRIQAFEAHIKMHFGCSFHILFFFLNDCIQLYYISSSILSL